MYVEHCKRQLFKEQKYLRNYIQDRAFHGHMHSLSHKIYEKPGTEQEEEGETGGGKYLLCLSASSFSFFPHTRGGQVRDNHCY